MSNDFGLIAANTSRTRAYLAALERHKILPAWTLVLDDESKELKLGQAKRNQVSRVISSEPDGCWSEVNFDPTAPLLPWLDRLGISYTLADSRDIHAPEVMDLISISSPSVLIYSGYGGVLLSRKLLELGKRFLHVHGGYLPDFKGSTTNYYSLLDEGLMGASAIFLTEEIDCGPILARRKFPAPEGGCKEIDHVYDAAARARVLVDTLIAYQKFGQWSGELQCNQGGKVYYVIHPILKHLAILGGPGKT